MGIPHSKFNKFEYPANSFRFDNKAHSSGNSDNRNIPTDHEFNKSGQLRQNRVARYKNCFKTIRGIQDQ